MARRGRNEGSISKRRDGRWQARLTTPEGRRKSLYGKNRQEVAQKLAQAQHDLVKGLPLVGERQTVEQYLRSWLGAMKMRVRSSTYVAMAIW